MLVLSIPLLTATSCSSPPATLSTAVCPRYPNMSAAAKAELNQVCPISGARSSCPALDEWIHAQVILKKQLADCR